LERKAKIPRERRTRRYEGETKKKKGRGGKTVLKKKKSREATKRKGQRRIGPYWYRF